MPRPSRFRLCIHERVLRPEGVVETILLDERYTPYEPQDARIENLCGSFLEYVHAQPLRHVVSRANGHRELFHLHGNVTLSRGKASFLAVRGMHGLRSLSRTLQLSSPRNTVHMAVLTAKIGKRAQVSSGGMLETALLQRGTAVRVMGRIFEHTNSIGFSILRCPRPSALLLHAPPKTDAAGTPRFNEPPFSLEPAFHPESNDWSVTGKGMVIIRLIWQGLEWSQAAEDGCTALCARVTDWLRSCS